MTGPICLVTGATAGIGKALAIGLAQRGATVILVARDPARGQAALEEAHTAAPNATLDLLLADLSSQAAVHQLVDNVQAKYSKLDVLINNAGIYKSTRTLTADGLETMFATNHLAPFLLTNLLLPTLQASGAARVLTLSAPSTTKLDFDNLQGETHFNGLEAFGATKMANLLFTFEAARRFAPHNVFVNAVHPGLVKSNIMQEAPAPIRWITSLISTSPQRAIQPIVRLALDPQFASAHGEFYKNAKPIQADAYATDNGIQHKLWRISGQLTHLY
jgi:NAD(P)-dependent dehydrogenase (short-subunit alcohol dehydrogenase family)